MIYQYDDKLKKGRKYTIAKIGIYVMWVIFFLSIAIITFGLLLDLYYYIGIFFAINIIGIIIASLTQLNCYDYKTIIDDEKITVYKKKKYGKENLVLSTEIKKIIRIEMDTNENFINFSNNSDIEIVLVTEKEKVKISVDKYLLTRLENRNNDIFR